VRLLAQRLVENRAVSTAAQAAPGLRELLALSVIRDLLRGHHDSVVLDAPASGHAAGLLDVPRTVAGVARVGPVRKRADGLTAMLEDPHRTRVVLVSTPHDLPVAETLETWERLASGRVAVAGTIANAVAQPAFEAADQAVLERIGPDAGPLARAALDAACSSIAAHAAQRERLDRLPRVLAELPLLHDGAAGRDAITELAAHLEHV
jgi:anion-transporting  ArsA/GET3 family ATPase